MTSVPPQPTARADRPPLALPGRDALRPSASADDRPDDPGRSARRVLRVAGVAAVLALVGATVVPFSRTVELTGQLVPRRTVTVRAAEPGLLHRVHVAAGDTLRPGALVASLRSPQLDEAFRLADPAQPRWALLARQARLDLHAPPVVERDASGAADPDTWWRGGIVLTEDLDRRRGAHVEAGEVVVELAALATDGRRTVPLVVRAWAGEREALRLRPGMPVRLTFPSVPQEMPRQASGVVHRIAPAPEAHDPSSGDARVARWRVEIALDADEVARLAHSTEPLGLLRAGFSVEASVQERRETLARTAVRWASARLSRSATRARARSGASTPSP